MHIDVAKAQSKDKINEKLEYLLRALKTSVRGLKRKFIPAVLIGSMVLPCNAIADTQAAKTVVNPKESEKGEKVLILLADFKDIGISKEYKDGLKEKSWNNYVFGKENSLKSYLFESSNGKMNIIPAEEASGAINDGIISVNFDMDYWNDITDPYANAAAGEKHDFKWYKSTVIREHAKDLINESLKQVDKFIDFKKYDVNGNGIVEIPNELAILFCYPGTTSGAGQYTKPSSYWEFIKIDDKHDDMKIGQIDEEKIKIDEKNAPESNKYKNFYFAEGDIGNKKKGALHTLAYPMLMNMGACKLLYGEGKYFSGMTDNVQMTLIPSIDIDPYNKIRTGFLDSKHTININENNLIKPTEQTLYSTTSLKGDYNVVKINTNDPKKFYLIENRRFKGPDFGLKTSLSSGAVLAWKVDETVLEEESEKKVVEVFNINDIKPFGDKFIFELDGMVIEAPVVQSDEIKVKVYKK